MIIDKELQLSNGQALTATADSENVVDTLAAGDTFGNPDLFLVVRVGTALTSGGASTLVITLVCDDNVGFSSATTLYTSASIAKAALTANTNVLVIPLPKGLERYFKLTYTVGTANFSAGTIDAFITPTLDQRFA